MLNGEKKLVYEKQAEVAKAVSHPLRVAVLDFLQDGEQCVCDIAESVGSERSNVSRHLSVMVGAGVLESRKEGLKVFYRVKAPCVLHFFECLKGFLAEQVLENGRLLKSLQD